MELFPQTGGLPLGKRHASRQRYRLVEMQRWREARDLPLVLKPKNWPFDFLLADCVTLAAAMSGPQDQAHAFIAMAFRAVWVEERNLADPETLSHLLSAGDYDPVATLELARAPATIGAYEGNRESAMAQDVFGSPAYVLDGEVFWGQDRLELLENALASMRAPFTPEA
jgi:2-hydroxychromene-2-carboxylate isomerase